MRDFPHIMIRNYLLHSDLVFFMDSLSENQLTMQRTNEAKSHCESLSYEDSYKYIYRYIVVLNV